MNADVKNNSNKRWLVLAILIFTYTFTFINRFIWGPLNPVVSPELGLTATQAGLQMSAFFVGYIVTQLPAGIISDKFNPKNLLIACTIVAGVSAAAFSGVNSSMQGAALRVVSGLAGGCVLACSSKIIFVTFPRKQLATAMGILMSGPALGILLVNAYATPAIASMGWRATCILTGVISIVIAALVLVFIRYEKTREAQPAPGQKTSLLDGLAAFFKNKNQIFLGLSGFMYIVIQSAYGTWTNGYVKSVGLSPEQASIIIMSFSGVGILATCFSGPLAVWLKLSHKSFLLLAMPLLGICAFIFSLPTSFTTLMAISLLFGLACFLPPTHYATSTMKIAGPASSATAMASLNLIMSAAGVIQPLVIGEVLDRTAYNYSYLWIILCACGILAALILAAVNLPKE
ncbi:MFS transporter [Desulfovibrio sp. OttesenSCG-928-C14]|nr:MFS transporter [Desulfovibrio sp. OttesenSCG-928-C14]